MPQVTIVGVAERDNHTATIDAVAYNQDPDLVQAAVNHIEGETFNDGDNVQADSPMEESLLPPTRQLFPSTLDLAPGSTVRELSQS